MDVELISPLPLETCLRRMQDCVDSSWTMRGSQPLVGRLAGTTLRARKRINYRNSFQSQLTARFSAEAGGTRISCSTAMHPFVVVFMAVWLGTVGLVAIGLLISTAGAFLADPARALNEDAAFGLIPVGMFGFGVGLVWLGRRIARGERRFLVDFVRQTLQAEPA